MAIRRRRKRKYTWFPVQRTTVRTEGEVTETVGIDGSVGVDGTAPAIQIYPLVPVDAPRENWGTGSDTDISSLNDVIGNEYVVERIVGKFFATTQIANNDLSIIAGAWITLGIFVARADESTPSLPLGGVQSTLIETINSFSPQAVATVREPWMFRRSWYLGARPTRATIDAVAQKVPQSWAAFPQTTAGYGSLQDGPHVDVKSVRRVRQDERLYAAVAVERLPLGLDVSADPNLEVVARWHFDYRILGALRRSKNRSNF